MAGRPKSRRAHGYSVYQRGDGRWGWGVVTGYNADSGNARRVQGIAKTQREATERALDARARVATGAEVPQGRDQSVGDYLDEWLDVYVRPLREPKTVAYYEVNVRKHIKPTLGRTPLRKLTAANVQRLLNERAKPFTVTAKDGTTLEKRLSSETLRGIRATLRAALSRAHKAGLVTENAGSRVETPKVLRNDPDFLEVEEIGALVKAAKGHPIEKLVTLALMTGLRLGEATGLRWEDVDLDKHILRVRVQLQRLASKLALKGLKSARSRRNLHLSNTGVELMRIQRAEQMILQASHIGSSPFNPLGLVFLNAQGRPFDPRYVDRHLKALMTTAGLKPRSFHKLRHTAATHALAGGVPLAVVRDMLGHSQIALTANTYSHAVPSAMKEAAEALERTLGR